MLISSQAPQRFATVAWQQLLVIQENGLGCWEEVGRVLAHDKFVGKCCHAKNVRLSRT